MLTLESIDFSGNVTEITDEAFQGCHFRSIVIPEGIVRIGANAFDVCVLLKEVSIPESVRQIGQAAFGDCNSLESVIMAEGVTEIEAAAFEACTSLNSVNIPDSVTKIGAGAFFGCPCEKQLQKDYPHLFAADRE